MYVEQVSPIPPEGGYPVALGVTTDRELNRWWGIPFFGSAVRWFLCIPHFVVLWVLEIALGLWMLLGWIYILAFGRVPAIVVRLSIEAMQRGSRVTGYALFLMPGEYPPLEPGPSKPINVQMTLDSLEINRLWGIPGFNWLFRFIVLIPHIIVVSILGTIAVVLVLIVWIPILAAGRYPDWAASYFGMTLRYATRMTAYFLFLPVPYPPIAPS
jgi:hypothetical protein